MMCVTSRRTEHFATRSGKAERVIACYLLCVYVQALLKITMGFTFFIIQLEVDTVLFLL